MMIMPHSKVNEHVDSGRLYWGKVVKFPSGACEMTVTKIPEARLRWLNDELPRKQKKSPFSSEECRGKTPSEINAEWERLKAEELEAKAAKSRAASIARSKKMCRLSLKTIAADHMATFSFRENVQDADYVQKVWQDFCRRFRIHHPGWQFVAVLERQERGAFHIHVGVHGRQDLVNMRGCWYEALGGSRKDAGEAVRGQVNVEGPKKRWREEGQGGLKWNSNKLAGYLCKYMEKTFDDSVKHAKRYWASKGVKCVKVGYWLSACSFHDAVVEAYRRLELYGHYGLDVRCRPEDGVLWLSAAYCDEDYCPF